jgi:nucleotide-binding universal stress UspA family protein
VGERHGAGRAALPAAHPAWQPQGRREPSAFKRLLVPLDGSETAAKALDLAARLAGTLDAEVVLFRASWVDPTDNALAYARDIDATKNSLREELEVHASALRSEGLRARSLVKLNDPAEAILAAVKQTGSDLIVMTTHGRTGFKRWLLGSVAEKVLRAAPRPVLLVRVQPE